MDEATRRPEDLERDLGLPMQARWSFLDDRTGELTDVDVILATPASWAALQESRDPFWSASEFGQLVVAVKCL